MSVGEIVSGDWGQGVHLDENGVEEDEIVPLDVNLRCYPNPFKRSGNSQNNGITIAFDIDGDRCIDVKGEMKVFNLKGQLIRDFLLQESTSGTNHIYWDGNDRYGRKVSSGLYFCHLIIDKAKMSKRMVLLK